MREAFAICFQRRIAVDPRGHVAEVCGWERLARGGLELQDVDRFSRT